MNLYIIANRRDPHKMISIDRLRREYNNRFDPYWSFDPVIAFQSEEVAKRVLAILSTTNHVAVVQFDYPEVPVIYTVPVSDENISRLPQTRLLTEYDLLESQKTSLAKRKQIFDNFKAIANDQIRVYELPNKILLQPPLKASYLSFNRQKLITRDISNKSEESLPLQVLSGFIVALGIAAVAVAFLVLQAASGGVFGAVVAGIGAAAMLSGGIGFFRFAYKEKVEPFKRQYLPT